jgi:O-antigen ligase
MGQKKTILNQCSFYTILLYFALQPFNPFFHRQVLIGTYITLFWCFLLSAFSLVYILKRKVAFGSTFELKSVLGWLGYLSLVFALTPTSAGVGVGGDVAYIFRGYVQVVPIFLLIMLRGMGLRELNAVVAALVLLMPFSVLIEYLEKDILSINELQTINTVTQGLDYNTYVPYITFSVFSAIYLASTLKRLSLRLIFAFIASGLTIVVFASPSRQSVAFLFVGAIVFVVTARRRAYIICVLCLIGTAVIFALDKTELADRALDRFFSEETMESARPYLMRTGIAYIRDPAEWMFGRSFSTHYEDINPHNNYIFTVIRTGLLGMALMFTPFFVSFLKSIRICVAHWNRPSFNREFSAYAIVVVLFTLFNSFFGYPHLDTTMGPVVWLGLSISVIFHQNFRTAPAHTVALRKRQ